MPRRQDHGGKKKTDTLKGFFSELITGLMQSTTDDLARNKLYGAHSGDFVLHEVRENRNFKAEPLKLCHRWEGVKEKWGRAAVALNSAPAPTQS